ncbi:MAG: hypothetical protein QXO93_02675 [Acidilobaceae archaeon]
MASKEGKTRKPKKVEKVEVKPEYVNAQLEVNLLSDIIMKAKSELIKEKYLTPYRVAQKYGVKISTARRLLKILASEGLLRLVGGTRRVPIYVPKGS